MLRPWFFLLVLLLTLATTSAAQSKAAVKPAAAKADFSHEAFVIEQFSSHQQFENDGTSLAENTARYRIQSEAGAQLYGVLSFSYGSATGSFEVVYVRVRKSDGTVVETPAENIQDMTSEITREAPLYSDLHEKHIAVKGLSVGDLLEYQVRERTTKPLAPGQFWAAYQFTHDHIILDEQLEIKVPRGRTVKVKSTKVQPTVSEAGEYRVYSFHSTNLESKDENSDKRLPTERMWQQARGRLPHADVLISSFASWDEVGRWYGGLQEDRVKPTPEINAKAAELTKQATTDEAKMRALYSYVSTQFRYIGVSFGVGRYQPHSAAEVMANQYGDCKDKHTLLASLLTAAGIPAFPALISTSNEVDQEVPSPGQFDHVITMVPRPGGMVWLDSTAEVGPYQYLISSLRDKHALAIWKDKPATLENTPVEVKYGTLQTFNMNAKLSDDGTLEGQTDISSRGDAEYILRRGFRIVPFPQWKDLAHRISQASGFGGEVSNVTVSSPEKTDEPFTVTYTYTRKEFGDWKNRRILAPMPYISLPVPTDDDLLPEGPMWLGPLSDLQFHSQMELPRGYRPELPNAVHLKQDFATYDATYQFKDGKLFGERHLKTLMREVPASEREQMKKFIDALQEDYAAFIPLSSASGPPAAESRKGAGPDPRNLRNLPDSTNEEAARLEKEARDDIAKRDMQGAVTSLYRAVSADPKFTRAWVMLGSLQLLQKQVDAGIDAFHKAVAIDPDKPEIVKALGLSLMAAREFEKSVEVWQDYSKAHPEDIDGPANLAGCLMELKRYDAAISAYESAVKIDDKNAGMQARLAAAYLLAGNREKAGAIYGKIDQLDPDQGMLNNVAYELAKADLELPTALKYSKKAVQKVESDSLKITLADLKVDDLRQPQTLAAYWDTLGWIDSRMSNYGEAQEYLQAAWMLTQDGEVAVHLCHVYEHLHKTAEAIQMCAIALHRLPLSEGVALNEAGKETDETTRELNHLTSGIAKTKSMADASDIVIRQRSFKLPRFLPGTESAEFFVLLSSDGKTKAFKAEDVKFISGSDRMKPQGKQLKNIVFNFPAPGGAITHFVRRGILGCYQYSGCSFVLLDPSTVKSLD